MFPKNCKISNLIPRLLTQTFIYAWVIAWSSPFTDNSTPAHAMLPRAARLVFKAKPGLRVASVLRGGVFPRFYQASPGLSLLGIGGVGVAGAVTYDYLYARQPLHLRLKGSFDEFMTQRWVLFENEGETLPGKPLSLPTANSTYRELYNAHLYSVLQRAYDALPDSIRQLVGLKIEENNVIFFLPRISMDDIHSQKIFFGALWAEFSSQLADFGSGWNESQTDEVTESDTGRSFFRKDLPAVPLSWRSTFNQFYSICEKSSRGIVQHFEESEALDGSGKVLTSLTLSGEKTVVVDFLKCLQKESGHNFSQR